jgi:hypothetical protein
MVDPNLTMTGWFAFLANRVREASLARAPEQIRPAREQPVEPQLDASSSPPRCPQCPIGSMVIIEIVARRLEGIGSS